MAKKITIKNNKTPNPQDPIKDLTIDELSKIEGISPFALEAKKIGFLHKTEEEVARITNFKSFAHFNVNEKTNRIISFRSTGKSGFSRKNQKLHERAIKHLRYLGLVSAS
jgi:ribosomal protein S18